MRLGDLDAIEKFIVDGLNNPDKLKAFGHDAIEIMTEVHYAPTIDAVPVVRGRWEPFPEDWRMQMVGHKCSLCGFGYYGDIFNYCPNCGARMDGE